MAPHDKLVRSNDALLVAKRIITAALKLWFIIALGETLYIFLKVEYEMTTIMAATSGFGPIGNLHVVIGYKTFR